MVQTKILLAILNIFFLVEKPTQETQYNYKISWGYIDIMQPFT